MVTRLGLSSGTAPRLAAAELAALVRGAGGSVADLRADKGHRWEDDGLAGLGGLAVSFVGLSVVLGASDQRPDAAARFPGLPVKVFAAPGAASAAATRDQLAALTADRAPDQVLVETHRGGAAPAELAELCARYGCRLVVDNLGLHEIADDEPAALALLAPWASAVQVKGFDPAADGGRPAHRPLAAADLGWLAAFRTAAVDITVESRAGTPRDDLAALRAAWEDIACA
ncbi:hypothetical protein [Actinomadura atramentaria]|uniref:hypothetical protein n=1 Tax=Actinomadura atramentaria TaxID=1990 RepID=UPI00035FB94D|nr:hypothetical protein [Actinomadura atramentaria]